MNKSSWLLIIGFLVITAVAVGGCGSSSSSDTTTTTVATTTTATTTTTTTTTTSTTTTIIATTTTTTTTRTTILYTITGWVATGECTSPEAYVVLIDTWNIGVANMISGEYQSFINGVLTYALTTSEPGTYWIAAASAFGDASLYWGGPGMTSLTTPWLPTTVEVGVYNLSVATFEMNVVWP